MNGGSMYFLGMFLGIFVGFAIPSGPSEVSTLKDGEYGVVATGQRVRLLEKGGRLIIFRGKEAGELPEGGRFTKETVEKQITTITPK